MDISELKAKHKLINRWHYKWTPIDKGYTDKTLYINVGTGEIKDKPVPLVMKEKFIGGKGYGLRLLWDATRPDTRWDDPDNEIVIASGPVGGITQYSGAGKSLVVTISPQTDSVMDSNVGGFFGPFLKFSGFDAIELQGKAANDVIVFINGVDHYVEVFEAPAEAIDSDVEQLTEMFANDESDRKNIGIVSTGSAADNSLIGMLNFTFYDGRRKKIRMKQAGRGGMAPFSATKRSRQLSAKFPA